MKQSALQLCQQNLVGAKAKDEAARAKLRADFPACAEIVEWMNAAGFKGGFRVVRMLEGDREWAR